MYCTALLRYAGIERSELIHNYKQFIRTALEYCSVAYHSSLTEAQSYSLERCQAVALRIILQEEYETYNSALVLTGLDQLSTRRTARCLDFSLKFTEHAQNSRFFPKNPNLDNNNEVRDREEFKINFARTKQYQNSAIPFCQKLLNKHVREKRAEAEELAGAEPGAAAGAGAGPRRGTTAGPRAGPRAETTAGPRAESRAGTTAGPRTESKAGTAAGLGAGSRAGTRAGQHTGG